MGSSRKYKEKRSGERRVSGSRSRSRSRSRSPRESRLRSDREKSDKHKRHHTKHHKSAHSKDRRKRAHSSSEEESRNVSQVTKEKRAKVKECKSPQQSDYHSSSQQSTSVHVKSEPVDNVEAGIDRSEEKRKQTTRKQEKKDDREAPAAASSSGNEISLSIEETNKLREKLGLKPLQVNEDKDSETKPKKTENGVEVLKSEPTKEIFVKTESLSEKQKTEKLKDRLNTMKEKRKIAEKLRSVKGLADDNEEDDLLSWVEKSRKLEEEKLKAKKKEQMLLEMDNEFGVDDSKAVEEAKRRSQLYTEKHLAGMTVAHSQEAFKEATQVILTLRDKEVLDENEDMLENVNIVDDEKVKKNIENKTKKADYRPYDEPEYDEFGILKEKSLLHKYDEEIEGPKKASFKLGSTNKEKELEIEMVRQRLRQQQGVISLEMPAATIAREYYTPEEMTKFKKPKKVKKVVRKKINTDDFLQTDLPSTSAFDLGPRKQKISEKTEDTNSWKEVTAKLNIQLDEPDIVGPDEDLTGVVIEEDEAQIELQKALEKARKLKAKEVVAKNDNIEKIALAVRERIKEEPMNEVAEETFYTPWVKSNNLVLNSTAEFCRNLGDVSTWDTEENEDDEIMDFEKEVQQEKRKPQELEGEDEEAERGKWNEVDLDAEQSNSSHSITEGPILEEEPDVSRGLAGALKLAMKKGYLDKEDKKLSGASRNSQLQAQNYTIEEKFYDDDKQGRRERYTGPVSDFRDKDGYKPDVKLEYIDEHGRILNQKEAFRVLSHKFHGKGPGKGKIDKRMKKLDQESKLRQMISTDTPLGTLKLLQEKQKELNSPYVVLSGGPTSLTKK
ncbi:U4/U6.U5 tri-snRNP-associated protein 1-like protein [Leptotrombidium deliense]|uniref:U4/U6.U5 tri-snRNP-associated protein 1-like protein n=1 Tax=Leptotrombidium deliense TaxID=299467 RepID=A0A443SM64_9ACAR|nr:U4/U6.U5 tri-snRNP-associated protein 1-like protein [Leptotrombidium deliense]